MKQPLALGIDIGGTNTALGIVTKEGTIVAADELPTKGHASLEDYITALKGAALSLFDIGGRENIVGIGVGAPNANFYTGQIAFAPNLPWNGVIPLAQLLNDALELKVTITNDAKAAAIGEMTYGAARGMKDFIMLTLGTGVGSGIVANGQLIYGHDGFAGELGHMIAIRDGRLCGCGHRGCLETYASATGIARTAKLWLEERKDETPLRNFAGNVTASLIYDFAIKGDPFCLEIFEFTGKILGQTLADAVTITSPEAIIFFGGLANARELILAPTRKHLEANLLKVFENRTKLLFSSLKDADAAILGASALAW